MNICRLILRSLRIPAALLAAALLGTTPAVQAQPAGTGTITGRVLNEGTGQYLRSAVVRVVGTDISVTTQPGGNYTIVGAPTGQVKLQVTYADLDPVETTVSLSPGQTLNQDISLTSKDYQNVVKLGAYVVATVREGNAKALQEQRESLDAKNIIASDAFGNVSEGNVGEFLKLMPGVQMDYVEADVRTMSIGGLDPKYTTIMMDGAQIASAGSSNIGTGRTFEFEQLSIASIESIELSKTPTPDVAGSALAGVVNLRTKGAFDRRGRQIVLMGSLGFNSLDLTLRKTPGPEDKKHRKVDPNVTIEFSDVLWGKLGVLAGFNYSYSFAEQKANTNSFVFDADPTNNRIEIPRLQSLNLQDSPKPTVRKNYNVRFDYRFSNDFSVWLRGDYNTYSAEFYSRDMNFDFRNPTGNTNTTVNSPGSVVPANAAVTYSLLDQTSTTGRATMDLNHGGQKKYGWTQTYSSGASYRRGALNADFLGSFSRATNWYKDVTHGFFNNAGTGQLPLNGVRFTRSSADNPDWQISSLGNVDFRNLALYPGALTGNSNDRSGEDQKYTLKSDFRYKTTLAQMPVNLKWGGAINESVRNIERRTNNYVYLGADRLPNTGDETAANFIEKVYKHDFPFGTNVQDFPNIDRWAFAREFGEHPERFQFPTPETLLNDALRNHWDTKEQIDALYFQPILNLTQKLSLAPGVRWEHTRGISRGPNDIGNAATQLILTGSRTGTAPQTTTQYISTRYGTSGVAKTDYDTWLKYLHANYKATNALTFRASYNESITRPDLQDLAGGIRITNDTSTPMEASVPNPDLKPERSRNVSFGAEYYFPRGGGFLTGSFTRRDIDQLIRTTPEDIPIGGSYAGDPTFGGFRINERDNVAKAHVSTIELNYSQSLAFLADRSFGGDKMGSFLRRTSIFANYTHLLYDNYENFRRPTKLANGGVNFGLGPVDFRWTINWTPLYRTNGYPANGWANLNDERVIQGFEANWKIRPNMTISLTGRNIFNDPTRTLYGSPTTNILNRYFEAGSFWTLGFRGVF